MGSMIGSSAQAAEPLEVGAEALRDRGALEVQYHAGRTLFFDFSVDDQKAEKKMLMNVLGGMTMGDNKTVYVRKGPEGSRYLVLDKNMRFDRRSRALAKFDREDDGAPKARRARTALTEDTPAYRPRTNTVTLRKSDISCNLPRYTGIDQSNGGTDETLRQMQPLPLITGERNFCADDPDMELNFQIDMFGSKPVTSVVDGRRVTTEAGKFVVVTVSPEAQAGAGWHITNDMQRYRDFSVPIPGLKGRARAESVGPFANRYEFWVRKPGDAGVQLVGSFPPNTAKKVDINEERVLDTGMTGMIGGKLTAGGSAGGTTPGTGTGSVNGGVEAYGQLTGSMLQRNTRKLSYQGSEYTIENKTSSRQARWSWDMRLASDEARICDYLNKRDMQTCLFTLPLMDTGWIVNTANFSAATYANFVPAFQATFKAAPGYANASSEFELGSSVTLASFLAAARPSWSQALLESPGNLIPGLDGLVTVVSGLMPNILKFTAEVASGEPQSATESFTVDWSQPQFEPEQNIRLQVTTPTNEPEFRRATCLNANAETRAVTLETCTPGRAQTWGYDAEEKLFKSRAVPGEQTCLAYPNMNHDLTSNDDLYIDRNNLVLMPCSGLDHRQKWLLETDGRLLNAHSYVYKALGGYVGTIDGERRRISGMIKNPSFFRHLTALPAQY
jgi:hypothetical protein